MTDPRRIGAEWRQKPVEIEILDLSRESPVEELTDAEAARGGMDLVPTSPVANPGPLKPTIGSGSGTVVPTKPGGDVSFQPVPKPG
jgi:hypothetical protein